MAVQVQTAVSPIDSRIVENACQHLRTVGKSFLCNYLVIYTLSKLLLIAVLFGTSRNGGCRGRI